MIKRSKRSKKLKKLKRKLRFYSLIKNDYTIFIFFVLFHYRILKINFLNLLSNKIFIYINLLEIKS